MFIVAKRSPISATAELLFLFLFSSLLFLFFWFRAAWLGLFVSIVSYQYAVCLFANTASMGWFSWTCSTKRGEFHRFTVVIMVTV